MLLGAGRLIQVGHSGKEGTGGDWKYGVIMDQIKNGGKGKDMASRKWGDHLMWKKADELWMSEVDHGDVG